MAEAGSSLSDSHASTFRAFDAEPTRFDSGDEYSISLTLF